MDGLLCICSCGCGNEVDERTDRRHRNGKGPVRIAAHHLSDSQFLDGGIKRPLEALGDIEEGRLQKKKQCQMGTGSGSGVFVCFDKLSSILTLTALNLQMSHFPIPVPFHLLARRLRRIL